MRYLPYGVIPGKQHILAKGASMRRLTYTIEPVDDGRQVQAILRERLHMGRQGIRAAKFRENGIMLDGRRVFTIDRVCAG